MSELGKRQKYKFNHVLEQERIRMKYVEIFNDLKIKNGMTIADVAEKSGLSRTTIHNLLSTKQLKFSEKAISSLEKCFSVKVDRESFELKRGGK